MGLSRRKLFTGIAALIAAPTIVRVASIMPVRSIEPDIYRATNPWWANATYRRYSGYDVLNITEADVIEAMKFNLADLYKRSSITLNGVPI